MKIVELTIEQPNRDLARYAYNDESGKFLKTPFKFMPTSKGYTGAYGWLNKTFKTSQDHLDVYFITQRRCLLGEKKQGVLCGALFRENHDHKMIVVDHMVLNNMKEGDIFSLPKAWWGQLNDIFGELSQQEKWIGAQDAVELFDHLDKKNQSTLNTSVKYQQEEQHKLMNQHLWHQLQR